MSKIYGVDTEKEVTSEMVRDAVVECFFEAHCNQAELVSDDAGVTSSYCAKVVAKAFEETGGSYESPTKSALLAIIPWLADFSKSFRDQETIKAHMGQIQQLMNLLK